VIEGRVKEPCEIDYDELIRMPSRTVTMTLECAGNSRIFLSPKVGGLQWELGAVSNAEWTGVPLAAVLKRAGVKVERRRLCSKSRQRRNRKGAGVAGENSLCAQLALGESVDAGGDSRSHNEWRAIAAFAWVSIAGCSPWLVWDGLSQVVDAHHCHRYPFRGYFQTADYTFWSSAMSCPCNYFP